jgi:DNA topoisomerase II
MSSNTNNNKTLEDIYQKKNPVEHVLIRPDTYIGSVEATESELWILGEDGKSFVNKNI